MSSATDIIAKIDTLVSSMLSDVSGVTTYKIGGKTVNKTEALLALGRLREQYQNANENTPYEDIRHIAHDYDELGQNISEIIGDSV
jgi:hypothetical protein